MLPLKHHTLLLFFLFPSFMGLFFLGFHISVGEKTSNETDKGLSILPTEEIILQKTSGWIGGLDYTQKYLKLPRETIIQK